MIPGPTTCLPQDSGEVEGEGTGWGPTEREERVVRPWLSIKNAWTSSGCSNPSPTTLDCSNLITSDCFCTRTTSDCSNLTSPDCSILSSPDFFDPDHSGLFDPTLDFSNFTIAECSKLTDRTFSVLKCNHCF